MKIQGYHGDKAELQAALERTAKQEFQKCCQLWERHWVMYSNLEGVPFE